MKQILHSFRTMLAIAALLAVSLNVQAATIASGNCGANGGSNCQWSIELLTGNVYQLRISGTGRMGDYNYMPQTNLAPWFNYQVQGDNLYMRERITSIVVEEGVTYVGKLAFSDFSKVTTITLPNSLSAIGDDAIYRNPALLTVNLPATSHLVSVGKTPVSECPALRTFTGADVINKGWYTYPASELIAFPAAGAYSYTVADGCQLIRSLAFDHSQLYEVTLPASLEEIGVCIFDQAANLTDIYAHPLTAPVCNSEIVTFSDPTKTSADINLHIHNSAYASYSSTDASRWRAMNIVMDMDPSFEGQCGDNATYSFDPATGILTISGTGDMWDYTSLTGHIAPWWTFARYWSTDPSWKSWSHWEEQYDFTEVQEIVIGEGITKVGAGTFGSCGQLRNVTFPSTLQKIGNSAFEWCGLVGITLPANLQEIGASAFYHNLNLFSITFTGTGELIIGSEAFDMTALEDIYAPWTDCTYVPTLLSGVFGTIDTDNPPTLHVKPGTADCYTNRNVWKDLTIVDDNYNEDDLIPLTVYLQLLNSDGTPVSGGGSKAPAVSGGGSGDCDFNVTFVDENGNPAEDDFSAYGLGLLRACQQFGGIFWRGQSTQAVITPSTTGETYEFDHWEIDYSDYEALENIQQSTLQHIYDNVSEDPVTHALTINLEYAIMPYYVEFGEVPFFPWNFRMCYKEKTVTPKYTVNLSVNIPYGGYIYGPESGSYEEGAELDLYAVPYPGYEFVEWSDGVTEATRTLTVSADTSLMAIFAMEVNHTVSVAANDNTMGTVTGGGSYKKNASAVLTATANEGYEFVSWNDGITDNPRTIIVTADTTLIATFKAKEVTPPVDEKTYYTVTLIANPADGGTFLGAGKYEEGATAVIAAQPNEGFEFVGWNDGVTTSARSVTVNDNIILVANFHRIGEGIDEVPSDHDQVQGTKLLRNGILIIRVGDKEYNAQGAELK